MLGLQNEREWAVFCDKVLGQPQLAGDARFHSNSLRNENRAELEAIIVGAFREMTADSVVARLESAEIANAHVNTMADVWNHPQLAARGRWTRVESAAGSVPALLPPAASDSFAYRMDAIPALGQHTDAVLGELGYSAHEIAALRKQGAI